MHRRLACCVEPARSAHSWALERAPQQLSGIVQSELHRAASQSSRDRAPSAPPSADELTAFAYGVLPEPLPQEFQKAALRSVVRPCAAALLQRAAGEVPENRVLSG